MDEFHRARAARVEGARDIDLVDELLALQRRHAGHAFAMRHADAVEIAVLLEHLRDAFPQVAPGDLGGVAGHVVVRIEIARRDVVRLREILAHEDAPEDDVRVEAALLGHPEDFAVEPLPLRELAVRPSAGFREVPRPDHVSERVQGPQRDRVEPVLDHHVEERFPVLGIPDGGGVLSERRARAIAVPGGVELDAPERERRRTGDCREGIDRHAVQELRADFERAVDESAGIAAGDRDAAVLRANGERFGPDCRIDGELEHDALRRTRLRDRGYRERL
jgi:hypothetical protein